MEDVPTTLELSRFIHLPTGGFILMILSVALVT